MTPIVFARLHERDAIMANLFSLQTRFATTLIRLFTGNCVRARSQVPLSANPLTQRQPAAQSAIVAVWQSAEVAAELLAAAATASERDSPLGTIAVSRAAARCNCTARYERHYQLYHYVTVRLNDHLCLRLWFYADR